MLLGPKCAAPLCDRWEWNVVIARTTTIVPFNTIHSAAYHGVGLVGAMRICAFGVDICTA